MKRAHVEVGLQECLARDKIRLYETVVAGETVYCGKKTLRKLVLQNWSLLTSKGRVSAPPSEVYQWMFVPPDAALGKTLAVKLRRKDVASELERSCKASIGIGSAFLPVEVEASTDPVDPEGLPYAALIELWNSERHLWPKGVAVLTCLGMTAEMRRNMIRVWNWNMKAKDIGWWKQVLQTARECPLFKPPFYDLGGPVKVEVSLSWLLNPNRIGGLMTGQYWNMYIPRIKGAPDAGLETTKNEA
jgi:hypothetical protein